MNRLLLAALAVAPATLPAQANPVSVLTPAIRSAVIDTVAAQLARIYVEPDTGLIIGERLKARAKAGAYDRLDNPAQFAEAVTRDLRSVNGDLHLSLGYSPTPPSPASGGGGGGPDPRSRNFGLGRLEILDGNIGYLEITGFMGAPGYQEVVVDALRFLARTDAIIIDLRRNGGGSGEMSHFVFSHFLGADPVETIRVRRRPPAEPIVRKSLAEVPGPRRTEVPLFLLTSQGTASAAEEFSFVLKNQRRVTIVGSRTAGAGHMVNFVRSGYGFGVGISITRVSDPASGKEWEGVGVQPDVAVPAERALAAAHARALEAVIAGVRDSARARTLGRIKAAIEASVSEARPDPSRLARWAGSYEGRVVSLAEGRLRFARRAGAFPEPLVWLGGDRFALGALQLSFEERDGAVRLSVEQPDGTRVTFIRS